MPDNTSPPPKVFAHASGITLAYLVLVEMLDKNGVLSRSDVADELANVVAQLRELKAEEPAAFVEILATQLRTKS